MSLEAAILGFLSEGDRSGYDLKTRCFDNEARDFWTADQAQIYRTLDRLQAAGFVRSSRRRQAGRPDRRVHSITSAGAQSLRLWLCTGQPLQPPRSLFLMQLYFAGAESDDCVLALLSKQRASRQIRLDELRARAAESARALSPSLRTAVLRDTAYDGAIAVERALIDWLDDSIEALGRGALPPQKGANDVREGLVEAAPA